MAFVQYETDKQKIENEYNKDRKQAVREESTKVPLHFLKKGKTIIRVLPPFNQEGLWFKEYLEHRVTVGGKNLSFTCARPYAQICDLCDKGEALSEAGDATYKDYQPRRTYLFNVMIMSDPSGITAKDGVRVLKTGIMVKKKLVDLDRAFAEDYGNITSVKEGFMLSVEREGETKNDTRYDVKPFRERTNLEEVLNAQNINFVGFNQYNLNEAVPEPRPSDEMQAAIEGKKAVFGFPAQSVAIPTTKTAPTQAPGITVVPVPVIPDPPSA